MTLRSFDALPINKYHVKRHFLNGRLKHTGQFQNFCGEVFQNGSTVYSGGGAHTAVTGSTLLQEAVNAAYWELEASTRTSRNNLGLGLSTVFARFSLKMKVFID